MKNSTRWALIVAGSRKLAATGGLLLLLAASVGTLFGDIDRSEGNRGSGEDGFTLFATPRLVLASNQFQCTLTNQGDICAASELGPGGVFPTGTPDSYFFNSGLQIAGITDDSAGPWAGDTIAAYMVSLAVGNIHTTPLTPIYDSRDPEDIEAWPADAFIDDPEVFAPVLQGRKTASLHDTWVRYWDGDPAKNAQRSHPMGVRVTQRSMSWTYPSGNETVIYFVLEFENVTNDSEFQRLNELAFFGGDDALPDSGWAYDDVYIAVTADNDVDDASENFTTAILPFDMGIAYHGGFAAGPYWQFPPSVFYPPFFTSAPGIAAIKYLKSPTNPSTGEEIGLSMISAVTLFDNSTFPDPKGSEQLWRYLAGQFDLSAGDPPCNVPAEIQTLNPATTERSVCFVPIVAEDIRFFQASGPFRLEPGEGSTVVAAWMVAPTVETMPDGNPSGIVANTTNKDANPPGVPSFHPGFQSARGCDPSGLNCTDVRSAADNEVQPILRGAGWVRYEGPAPSGDLYPAAVEHPSNRIEQLDVQVVPGSLLGRALVAQSVFDNDFLLGFAPEAPAFYLVPGHNNVTVIWDPSATDILGDPFFEVAGDPESALYNPNYREFDVEGYRIWRGTQRGQLELIEQFDFADTRFLDYTCETVHPEEDAGAQAISPETGNVIDVIGYAAGEICPFDQDNPLVRDIDGSLVFNNGGPGGPPGGGVSRNPAAARVDTAIVSDRDIGEVRPLRNTGVPYLYVDTGVIDNFTYFYSVTAFDVNSQSSGPHTLRSAMIDQATVPRADAPNLQGASLQVAMTGDDGVALNAADPMPTLDPEDGTFSGPMPPTDGIEMSFAPLLPRLLPQFELQARIDSVKPDWVQQEGCAGYGWAFPSVCWRAWLTVNDSSFEVAGLASNWNGFGRPPSSRTLAVNHEVPFDPAALEAFGIPAASGAAQAYLTVDEAIQNSNWEGQQNRRGATANTLHGGPRWFNGTQETASNPDPTAFIKVGRLAEVDSVWIPIHHTQMGPTGVTGTACENCIASSGSVQYFGYYLAFLGRAADIRVTWTDGTITVRDVTHNVDVPFSGEYGSSWGFLNDDGDGDGTVSWWDFFCVGADAKDEWELAFGEICPSALTLSPTPTVHPIMLGPNTADAVPETVGNGFTLYLNGMRHFFLADGLPPDGTVWTLRTYNGSVTASSRLDTFDPSGYAYVPIYDPGYGQSGLRSPLIPGLTIGWKVEAATAATGPTDLSQVHTVPDPYLATSRYDLAPSTKQLMFVNLPPVATIRIYTLTGVLVDIVNHDDVTGGGRAVWDLRNRNNQFIASGVYFFHVVTPEGETHVGKFTVLMSAT